MKIPDKPDTGAIDIDGLPAYQRRMLSALERSADDEGSKPWLYSRPQRNAGRTRATAQMIEGVLSKGRRVAWLDRSGHLWTEAVITMAAALSNQQVTTLTSPDEATDGPLVRIERAHNVAWQGFDENDLLICSEPLAEIDCEENSVLRAFPGQTIHIV